MLTQTGSGMIDTYPMLSAKTCLIFTFYSNLAHFHVLQNNKVVYAFPWLQKNTKSIRTHNDIQRSQQKEAKIAMSKRFSQI